MKISHETPIELLKLSLQFNDYSYALVHLLEEQPEYLAHFEMCRDKGIPVLLDNSIFELEEAFSGESFAKWVRHLKPDEYIIPDVLEDGVETVESMNLWLDKYSDLPGKKIGVVQGKTYEDIVNCYRHIDRECDKIAISFNYSLYEEMFPHANRLISWMNGRIMLLEKLLKEGVVNTSKPHHLLGCSLPQEFIYYRNYNWIDSLDTSNPIVHGILEIGYEDWGLLSKESIKLCDMITYKVGDMETINRNVAKFRDFATGTYVNKKRRDG